MRYNGLCFIYTDPFYYYIIMRYNGLFIYTDPFYYNIIMRYNGLFIYTDPFYCYLIMRYDCLCSIHKDAGEKGNMFVKSRYCADRDTLLIEENTSFDSTTPVLFNIRLADDIVFESATGLYQACDQDACNGPEGELYIFIKK